MKQVSMTDLKRLELKVNLLNEKIDRIMEVQGIALVIGEDPIQKEEDKKRKIPERQQQKQLEKEQFQQRIRQHMEERAFVRVVGGMLQRQFNLAALPSAVRIREYQLTKDTKAFDGLKRVSQGSKK